MVSYDTIQIRSLIREVFIQSCSAGAKNFTNYVFCHPQFSSVIQNIENRCTILSPVCLCIVKVVLVNHIHEDGRRLVIVYHYQVQD